MVVRVFLLIVLSVFLGSAQPTLPRELTLSQALDIALSNNTSIRTAMAQLDQTSGKSDQWRSALLPHLELEARQAYLTLNLAGIGIELPTSQGFIASGLIGPFASMGARVFFSQQILNISAWRAWKSSRSHEDSSRLLIDNARELVALRVVATYLDALRARATRDTLLQQAKLATDLYGLTRERVSRGVAAELDANRAMQQVNTLVQQRQEAEQRYVEARLALATILQARITAEFDVADPAAYGTGDPPERDLAIKAALATRADYRSAQATVDAAQLQLRSTTASRLPTVEMTLDDGQSGNTPVHNVNTYRVQGSINFPIFTGGRIRGEITEAEGALREAQSALEANRSQIEADVLAAISGVHWALLEVETSEGNVKLSQQEVEFSRSRFAQGIVDNTEVVNAQERLERAADARIRAQFTLGLARANLARATGVAEKAYRR